VLDPGDESEMTFVGFLAFQDSPKAGVGETVAELGRRGVRLCMLTGDNQLAAAHIARTVGVADPRVLVGAQIAAMDDSALRSAVAAVDAFAELSPAQKERVIEAFRASGAVVGYLGDGINDAGSLHLADVGISVDTAVDVAKSAADVVLLDKGLDVLVEGVRLGRRTFANTLKYVSTTISANFGNTASMAAASAFLPFLPLLPRQILLLNFLTDLPSVAIADDHVDPEQLERPRRWDVHEVARFMVVFGLLSSAFDLITFAVMVQVFDAGATLFRSAWFVGSTLTEIAVLLVLRTHRLGFRSSPGRALVLASAAVGAVVMTLPYLDPVADPLGLGDLPLRVLVTLVGITAVYVVAAELTKGWFYGTARWPRRSGGARDHQHRTSRQRRLQHVVDEHRRR
jgi:Mg2+-importing ATPase